MSAMETQRGGLCCVANPFRNGTPPRRLLSEYHSDTPRHNPTSNLASRTVRSSYTALMNDRTERYFMTVRCAHSFVLLVVLTLLTTPVHSA